MAKKIMRWSRFLELSSKKKSYIWPVGTQVLYDNGKLPQGLTSDHVHTNDILDLQRDGGLPSSLAPGKAADWLITYCSQPTNEDPSTLEGRVNDLEVSSVVKVDVGGSREDSFLEFDQMDLSQNNEKFLTIKSADNPGVTIGEFETPNGNKVVFRAPAPSIENLDVSVEQSSDPTAEGNDTIPTTAKVEEMIGGFGAGVEIVDNLESTRTNAALSANQGRILDESKLNAQSSPNMFSPLPKSSNFESGYGERGKKIEPGENGAVTVTDNFGSWFVSKYISVTPGKKYTTGCTGACNVVFVTSSQSTSSATQTQLNANAIAIDGKKVNTISASQYIEAPEGAAYMLISARKGYGSTDTLMNALRIYETDGLSNRFVPLTNQQTDDTVSVSDASKLRSGLMVSEPVIGKNIVKCYNPRELISGYVAVYSKNKPFTISTKDASGNDASNKEITGRIPIIGGATYYVQQNVSSVPLLIYFFNKNDEFVEKYQSGSAANDIVVAPVTATWARIQYNNNSGLNCVVFTLGYYNAPGTEMDQEQGYAKRITIADAISGDVNNSPSVSTIPTLSLNLDLIRELLTNDHQYDYWKGKKLFVDGDSISHYIDSMPFWQQHVANNLRMEFAIKQIPAPYYKANDFICIGDRGYGGTRLCPTIEKFDKNYIKKEGNNVIGSNTSSNKPLQIERCLTWRVAEGFYADVEADLFILFIGSNDWGHPDDFNGGLGSISDAPFDPSSFSFGTYTLVSYNGVTFYGCLKYVVEWFIKNKPEADLVLLTPIKRDDDIHNANNHRINFQPNNDDLSLSTVDTPSHKLADYADAIKEVGKLYGVPVCDLFSTCFMNPGIGSPNAETESALENSQLKYYFDNYNVSGSSKKRDTTHPGPRGHEKIGRLVTGFLKSLC